MKLKTKVLFVVGIGFFLFSIGVLEIALTKWFETQEYNSAADAVQFFKKNSGLIEALAVERGKSVNHQAGVMTKEDVLKQRTVVDKHASLVAKLIPEMRLEKSEQRIFHEALKSIETIRAPVFEKPDPEAIMSAYSGLIKTLIDFSGDFAERTQIPEFASTIRTLQMLEQAREYAGQFRAKLTMASSANVALNREQLTRLVELRSQVLYTLTSSGLILSAQGAEKRDQALAGEKWAEVEKSFHAMIDKFDKGEFGLDAPQIFALTSNFVAQLSDLIRVEQDQFQKVTSGYSRRSTWIVGALLLVLACSPIVFFVLTRWLLRSIVEPIRKAIGEIRSSSGQVTSVSKNLGEAGSKLAINFHQMAASLQETVSTMSEINSMVTTNLNKAEDAKNTSFDVSRKVMNGDTIVGEMVASMVAVQKANKQLGTITKMVAEISAKTNIINDIVFKTQLLSINASIEAARAGRHGKGFAVVAEEVGNLAQTSGLAADEIRNLIEKSQKQVAEIIQDTSERVTAGMKYTENAKVIFDEVAKDIALIAGQIQVVAEASNEQKIGIEQITAAFADIDSATQTSTGEVNLTAGMANELYDESKHLLEATNGLAELVNDSRRGQMVSRKKPPHSKSKRGLPPKPPTGKKRSWDESSTDEIVSQLSDKITKKKNIEEISPDDDSFIQKIS